MKPSPILPIVLAATLTAGAAQAQMTVQKTGQSLAAVDIAPVARPIGVAAKATPDLADPLDPIARPKLATNTLDSEVFATTAVDHKFGKRDDLTGSLGFLCGRQPGHTENGGEAAFGSDPHGRFVGAKLSLAF